MSAAGEHRRVKQVPWEDSEAMSELSRRLTPPDKLVIMDGMWRSARFVLANLARLDHPEWTDEQARAEAGRQMFRLHAFDDVPLPRGVVDEVMSRANNPQ